MKESWSRFNSSFGEGAVVCFENRIAHVLLPQGEDVEIGDVISEKWPNAIEVAPTSRGDIPQVARVAARVLERAVNGELDASALIDHVAWPTDSTEFQVAVLKACSRIQCGHVMTYGELAQIAGHPKSARAVGSVMATNPLPLIIPCHRVIRSDRTIGEYGGGSDMKRHLLEVEGAMDVILS